MAKTKTKGTAKTVSDTPVPQPITISSTNPKIMADNIKKLEKAIKGADDASEISYDNTESHLTASNVQAAIDEVVTGLSSLAAEDVSYDNTDSGLTADDVQAAIDEVFANFSNYLPKSVVYENITFVIGEFELTTGGNTLEVTGIKVTRGWDNRYTIIGMVLSGSTFPANFIAYSSWNDKLVKISPQ